jgi:hypothetical protein
MRVISLDESTFKLDHSTVKFGYDSFRINAFTVEELFRHYEKTGFIYPEKRARLAPYCNLVKKNWEAALKAGEELFYIISAGDSEGRHLATITFWRSTLNGWVAQHLTSTGNPLHVKTLFEGASHLAQNQRFETIQNWFRPQNKYAKRVFGTLPKTATESTAMVSDFNYLSFKHDQIAKTSPINYVIRRVNDGDIALLNEFIEIHRGSLYAKTEEINSQDFELEELNDLYQRVGLFRKRRGWMAFRRGRSDPDAVLISYSGSLGINFSYLENRCDLICEPSLEKDIKSEICQALLLKAVQCNNLLPLDYLLVVADFPTSEVLFSSGASLIRQYSQNIWVAKAFFSWLRHVQLIYQRIGKRHSSRLKQQ